MLRNASKFSLRAYSMVRQVDACALNQVLARTQAAGKRGAPENAARTNFYETVLFQKISLESLWRAGEKLSR